MADERTAPPPRSIPPAGIPGFLTLCESGEVKEEGMKWGLPGLEGPMGVMMACEVLLRDVVGGGDDDPDSCGPGPCGAMIKSGTMAYKCMDCGADPTCVMCVACFQRSPCVNHSFRLVKSHGGSCDCGDKDAWKPESFCSAHKHAPTSAEAEAGGISRTNEARDYTAEVFRCACEPLF
eukprot:CAMPEP_0173448192 /NCGR_PEP_ID=MMETSP1357-20121228/40283_1 /TAXON_ID=77926 /ORGANISM="Hemiselmis rufescens, Strain PCC563" /LENGTH=177 /DNA_ID=CAMNT_0014414677 /DNA_START=1 /DNA_END=531 /DNA_ORIENTATION=+